MYIQYDVSRLQARFWTILQEHFIDPVRFTEQGVFHQNSNHGVIFYKIIAYFDFWIPYIYFRPDS